MNQILLNIIFIICLGVIIGLSASIVYMVFLYRKLLEKYADLSIKTDRSIIKKKINEDTQQYVSDKLDTAISKATDLAVDKISKNADKVAQSMRQKTIEKLLEEEKGQEVAVSSEYDQAKAEIEEYKKEKYEEIRKNASEILAKLTVSVASKALSGENQESLIMKALEDAKRSNLL